MHIERKTQDSVIVMALKMPLRLIHLSGVLIAETLRRIYGVVIARPVMWSLCNGGRRLKMERIPYIRGRGRILLGSNVYISGKIGIAFSLHASAVPELRIGEHVFIGHNCAFAMAERISIGRHCLIGAGTRIQDNDGHPLDAESRRKRLPVRSDNVKPVAIGNNVWIAPNCIILKGVNIGDNAVIGAGSVVTKNVPENSIAVGSPAAVVRTIES